MSERHWELTGFGSERLVVRRMDEPPADDWAALSPETAVFQLAGWMEDAGAKGALVDMVASLGLLPVDLHTSVEGLPKDIERDLVRAFLRRELVIFSKSEAVAAPTLRPNIPVTPKPVPARRPVVEVTTWVELLVVNEQGEPMPGVAYRITLPDGIQRTGTVDRFGLVRLTGVDPGQCVFELPDVDGRAWSMG